MRVAATYSSVLILAETGALAPIRQVSGQLGAIAGGIPTCSLYLHSLTRHCQNLDLSVLPRDPTREFGTSLVPSRSAFVIPALSLVKRLPRAQTPPNTVISMSAIGTDPVAHGIHMNRNPGWASIGHGDRIPHSHVCWRGTLRVFWPTAVDRQC